MLSSAKAYFLRPAWMRRSKGLKNYFGAYIAPLRGSPFCRFATTIAPLQVNHDAKPIGLATASFANSPLAASSQTALALLRCFYRAFSVTSCHVVPLRATSECCMRGTPSVPLRDTRAASRYFMWMLPYRKSNRLVDLLLGFLGFAQNY